MLVPYSYFRIERSRYYMLAVVAEYQSPHLHFLLTQKGPYSITMFRIPNLNLAVVQGCAHALSVSRETNTIHGLLNGDTADANQIFVIVQPPKSYRAVIGTADEKVIWGRRHAINDVIVRRKRSDSCELWFELFVNFFDDFSADVFEFLMYISFR